jgi:phosphatidate cytidylyltransferase
MKNILSRTLVFFLLLPALLLIIIFLPFRNHLIFNILTLIVSAVSAFEVRKLFASSEQKRKSESFFLPVIASFIPLLALLEVQSVVTAEVSVFLLIICTAVIFISQTTVKDKDAFPEISGTISRYVMVLLYPGLFLSFLIRMTGFEHARIIIITFILAVYLNDTIAYISGKLFGRGDRVIVAVSPKKSLVGFICGFLASPALIYGSYRLFPEAFPFTAVGIIVMGLVIGITTIFGDLVESALKRGAMIKDSGQIIPGRGGLLDSIDSIALSAPFFYFLYRLLPVS